MQRWPQKKLFSILIQVPANLALDSESKGLCQVEDLEENRKLSLWQTTAGRS
jgi:hypothetical protein